MAKTLKPYTPNESNLVYEWVKKFYPNSLQWRRVRLGPLPLQKDSAMYGILRRWADLIFKDKGIIYIVEAKMKPEPGAIGQLKLYNELFPKTPEFSEFKDLPRKLIFLTTVKDLELKKITIRDDIEYVVYQPDWVKEYWLKKRGGVPGA